MNWKPIAECTKKDGYIVGCIIEKDCRGTVFECTMDEKGGWESVENTEANPHRPTHFLDIEID